MGDEAIKAAAQVLSHALRSSDTVGRLSGDEFAAIAIGMDLTYEKQFREKIQNLCSCYPEHSVELLSAPISACIGT